MNLQAMTKEKLHFILPVVFTIGPDVNQQGRPDSAAPDRHDVAKSVDDRGDALMKYAMLLADSDSKDENHNAFLENIIRGIIEGETRVLVSNMTMEEIFTEGETFKRRIFRNIQGELDQLGLKVHKANVTQLKDSPDSVYFASSDRKAHHGATNKTNIGEGIPEPGKYGEDMAYHGDTSPCSDPRLSSGGLVELRQPVNREDAAMTYGQESTAKEMEVLYQGSPTTSWYLAILQVLTGEGTETRDMEKHTETSPDVDKYTALYKRRGGGGSGGGGGGGGGGRGARLSEHRHKPLSNAIRITAKQVKLCGLGVASWLVTGVAAQDPRPGARVGILQNVTTSGFGTVSWIAGLVGIQIGDMDVVPIATRIRYVILLPLFLLLYTTLPWPKGLTGLPRLAYALPAPYSSWGFSFRTPTSSTIPLEAGGSSLGQSVASHPSFGRLLAGNQLPPPRAPFCGWISSTFLSFSGLRSTSWLLAHRSQI